MQSSVVPSLSVWRAWIEILHTHNYHGKQQCRSLYGERGLKSEIVV